MAKDVCIVDIGKLCIWKDWLDNRNRYETFQDWHERLAMISVDIDYLLKVHAIKEEEDGNKKKNEFCMDCRYWDGESEKMWERQGGGYCRHGPPTAGCNNQKTMFPVTSEYDWCWQWRKSDGEPMGGIR
jgi:hypothetical protein